MSVTTSIQQCTGRTCQKGKEVTVPGYFIILLGKNQEANSKKFK